MKHYKCSDHTFTWFTSYLKGRSQCTVLKGKSSAKFTIKTGVPQGSVIGPLLFILFINDRPLALDNSDTDMYADDSSVTTSARTVLEIEQHLVEDADKVSTWSSENHMAVNTTKTKVMLITTWQMRASLPEHQRTLKFRMDG